MTLRGVTQSHHYGNPSSHQRDLERVMGRSWQFVGFKNSLSKHNDFLTTDVAGLSIFIQNFHGNLRAFHNVCPHRFSRLHDEESGNRNLACKYHGWTFNENGEAAGVPRKKSFGEDFNAKSTEFCLRSFELEAIGNLLFLKVDPNAANIKTYFKGAYEFLLNVGNAINEKVHEHHTVVKANWKILIENSLEGYHVPMVHSATLAAFPGLSPAKVEDHVEESGLPHSHMINGSDPAWMEKFQRVSKHLGPWPFKFDHYIHHLFFPNLTITSFLGYSFHIQRFHPISPTETRVDSYTMSTHFPEITKMGKGYLEAMYREGNHFSTAIFAEDGGVCELMQKGVPESTGRRSIFCEDERRVWGFQNSYVNYLEDDNV